MKFSHFCFDLDGTIVNSFPTIYKCTLKTLNSLDIVTIPEEKLFYNMIGHHFSDIFTELKINVTDIEGFINLYKTFYFDYMEHSVLYPGIANTLAALKKEGMKISLLTTKAQDQADKIIDHFSLRSFFDSVYGRRSGLQIKPHPEPLLKICEELNAAPSETLMVGDSELDIRCGKNAGAKTCAVSYGYRTMEILQNEYPDFLIDNFEDLRSVLAK
jgi:phosphoglycolate phosphatase